MDHNVEVEGAEMRMLRWTCGRTLLDRFPNTAIRNALGVTQISEKLREGRLRWYGHVQRRLPLAPVRRVDAMVIGGKRRRGRPRRKWEDSVRPDMEELGLSEDMTSDMGAWRSHITVEG